jgi:hypothetical protein
MATRGRHWKKFAIAGAIAVAAALFCRLFTGSSYMIWDGGYGQAEIEISFLDKLGHPVPGVQLRVQDPDCREFFLYPVSDYLPDHIPTSDEAGQMMIHHVSHGVEFSGRCYDSSGHWVDIKRGPIFYCLFLHKGQEVTRIQFGDLDHCEQTWESMPRVKRKWQRPIWPTTELYTELDESFGDWDARLRKYYDPEQTGHFTPETAPAYHAATSVKAEHAAIAWQSERKRIEDEEEFAVIKRTIIVAVGSN